MSTPSTPTPNPTTVSVTPGTALGTNLPGDPPRFEDETLSLIVNLIAPGSSEAVTPVLNELFAIRWQVMTWSDLVVFNSADVINALQPGTGISVELTAPVVAKKLGYIVDYARIGKLTPTLTMNEIVISVNTAHRQKMSPTSLPNSPSHRMVQIFDKKAVPTLEKFSGSDEDYFAWRESTINVLGTAGFGRFLDDETMVGRFPDVAESVFYALRGAVHGGQAQSIAQGMLDDKKLEPGLLWSALEEYYNTALNRANVVLFDIRRLLNIRLDNNSTATKFLSDFRDCLQRLRKNNARLSEDSDTLRALLLVAIQDDDFELVRDSIVHKPDSSVESILTEIRERETSLMMKDRAANPGGDTSRHSRRAKLSTSSSNRSKNDTGSTAADKQLTKWNIPRLPDSWKKSFGNSLFKLILDWRTDAHKGMAQEKLSANYETVVETFSPRTKGNKTNKTSQSSAGDDQNSTATTSDTSGAGSGTSESTEPPRKRIRLQKRRRVVTERST